MNATAAAAGFDHHGFIVGKLTPFVNEVVARGILNHAMKKAHLGPDMLAQKGISRELLEQIHRGIDLFIDNPRDRLEAKKQISQLAREGASAAAPAAPQNLSVPIRTEQDIVTARNLARKMAHDLGFTGTEQVKIATAVSELTRNIVRYVGDGTLEIEGVNSPRPGLRIVASDQGPGIANLDEITNGQYKSRTGLGLGIMACKKLMDQFDLQTGPQKGTRITLHKFR